MANEKAGVTIYLIMAEFIEEAIIMDVKVVMENVLILMAIHMLVSMHLVYLMVMDIILIKMPTSISDNGLMAANKDKVRCCTVISPGSKEVSTKTLNRAKANS